MKKKMLFLVMMLFIICSFNLLAKKSSGDIKLPDSTYKLLEKFSKNKEKTMEKLKTLNKDKAVKLYWEYCGENEELLSKITMSLKGTPEKNYKNLKKILNEYGLEFFAYSTPGFFDIGLPRSFYYDMFKDYVTDVHKEYLKILYTKEPSSDYTDDQNEFLLLVSPQELGDRIIECENFLKKYSNINDKYDYEIGWEYINYIKEYIFYTNNIKFEYENIDCIIVDKKAPNISKKMLQEYERFIKKYPNSRVTEILKLLLQNYKDEKKCPLIWEKLNELVALYCV